MIPDEFVSKYEGKTLGYPQGSYVGECLSLVKIYIQEVFNISPPPSGCNGARCYWSKFPQPLDTVFTKVPYKAPLVPKKGWIVVWDENTGGGYGHIAIVLSANTTSFVSFDQNWGGKHAHKVTHNYNHVYGFLVPKGEDTMIEVKKSDWDRLLDASRKGDNLINALGLTGNIADKDEAELNQLYNLKFDADRYKKERNDARLEVTRLTEEKGQLADKLEQCENNDTEIRIGAEVEVGGITWEINGVEVDSNGVVTANYARKN